MLTVNVNILKNYIFKAEITDRDTRIQDDTNLIL